MEWPKGMWVVSISSRCTTQLCGIRTIDYVDWFFLAYMLYIPFFFLASIIDNRFFFLPQVVHAHNLHACLPWKRIFLFLCLENDFT